MKLTNSCRAIDVPDGTTHVLDDGVRMMPCLNSTTMVLPCAGDYGCWHCCCCCWCYARWNGGCSSSSIPAQWTNRTNSDRSGCFRELDTSGKENQNGIKLVTGLLANKCIGAKYLMHEEKIKTEDEQESKETQKILPSFKNNLLEMSNQISLTGHFYEFLWNLLVTFRYVLLYVFYIIISRNFKICSSDICLQIDK